MKYNIIIVGCGGTGGHFIVQLGRYLFGLKSIKYQVTIIDQDIVEEGNINRQPYQTCDIGRNKAAVMVDILQVFQIDCGYVSRYIKKTTDLAPFFKDDCINVLFGCVDNHPCRKILHSVFIECKKPIIYIDSANGKFNGEIVVAARLKNKQIFPDRVFYYPEVLTEEVGSRLSCMEHTMQSPQHMVANLMAATICLEIVVQIIEKNKIKGGIHFFNVDKGYVQYRPYHKEMENMNDN